MEEFKLGDVVQLKSGGPEMTIYRIDGSDIACTWFVKQEPKYNSFPKEVLEKVEHGGTGGIFLG